MTAQELEEKVWQNAQEFGILTQALKDKENRLENLKKEKKRGKL